MKSIPLFALTTVIILGTAISASAATQCRETSTDYQKHESVEAAKIHRMNCNGNQVWIYEYLHRTGFRVIVPPNWANRIGGRDFNTFEEAVAAAEGRY